MVARVSLYHLSKPSKLVMELNLAQQGMGWDGAFVKVAAG